MSIDEQIKTKCREIGVALNNRTPRIAAGGIDRLIELRLQKFADEAAKSAPQPVADVDVPEWFVEAVTDEWFATEDEIATTWRALHTELLSRRVAEVTEAKDKRIGELEDANRNRVRENALLRQELDGVKKVAPQTDGTIKEKRIEIRRLQDVLETRNRQLAERDKRIAELEAELVRDRMTFSQAFTEQAQRNVDYRAAADEAKQQLAASQAEVARLSRLNETPRSFDEAVHGVQSMIDAMGSMDRNRKEIAKLREEVARLTSEIIGNLKVIPGAIRVREGGADEDVAKSLAVSVAKLVDENKRLSRPVEVDWGMLVRRFISTSGNNCGAMQTCVEPLLQSERNAREAADKRAEAAERERDELREFVKTKSAWSCCLGSTVSFRLDNRAHNIPDAELDRLLTAYRAEKGKVQQ